MKLLHNLPAHHPAFWEEHSTSSKISSCIGDVCRFGWHESLVEGMPATTDWVARSDHPQLDQAVASAGQ